MTDTISKDQVEKPPLGLRPDWVWLEHRAVEISVAITEYLGHSKQIPMEWFREYNKIIRALDRRKAKLKICQDI